MTTQKYSKAARTRAVALELLERHAQMPDGLPTSIRFLFYELEQQGLATKPSPDDMRPNKHRSIGWPPREQDIIDAVTWLLIEANTRRVLERAAGYELDWERLGMTAEQAEDCGITPIVKRDGRTREVHEAVEVEALGQAGVIELVRATLDGLLPEPLGRVLWNVLAPSAKP
jgi:hypothetical protein